MVSHIQIVTLPHSLLLLADNPYMQMGLAVLVLLKIGLGPAALFSYNYMSGVNYKFYP